MRIVVTGGLGFLGSHVVHKLIKAGHEVVTVDRALPGQRRDLVKPWHPFKGESFVHGDVIKTMDAEVGQIGEADAVIHLAALINAPQSVWNPALYYRVNFMGTLHALELARALGCGRFVLASSAAVYGPLVSQPTGEDAVRAATENPYGGSKLFGESLVRDFCKVNDMTWSALRLFNLIGVDPAVGVVPNIGGLPSLLVQKMQAKKLRGEETMLTIYGGDHPTADGSCVRDFVHVSDAAEAFKDAVEDDTDFVANVGTGQGTSVLEMAEYAEIDRVTVETEKRPGEVSVSLADVSFIEDKLGWRPENTCVKTALEQEFLVRTK